ncbi:hypothetical protein Poly30_37470 [Planctomycetes bacterium Poly30]|uniref:Uncharacterized protein n=1 Tax=Saltatorellus ferox TaxID=2528018 RepID=A0A518EVU3_9BACT|nr:hypothetical protein Poly30_37470 [Planctomycetes bacterium Poly30]
MTRKFRLGLFVSVAAAVGLHVRPCWTCCWISSCDGAVHGTVESAPVDELHGAAVAPGDRLTASATEPAARPTRPVLRSMWRSASRTVAISTLDTRSKVQASSADRGLASVE